jgi:hypothetical protein
VGVGVCGCARVVFDGLWVVALCVRGGGGGGGSAWNKPTPRLLADLTPPTQPPNQPTKHPPNQLHQPTTLTTPDPRANGGGGADGRAGGGGVPGAHVDGDEPPDPGRFDRGGPPVRGLRGEGVVEDWVGLGWVGLGWVGLDGRSNGREMRPATAHTDCRPHHCTRIHIHIRTTNQTGATTSFIVPYGRSTASSTVAAAWRCPLCATRGSRTISAS